MGLGSSIRAALGVVAPGAIVQRGSAGGPGRVAITFDDGPHPEQTPRILDSLDEHGARATFFVVGSKVESFGALTREVAARGHQLANHGFSHRDPRRMSPSAVREEVWRTHRLIEDTIGAGIAPDYRPPYGRISPLSFIALVRDGFRFVYWSKDSRDYEAKSAQELLTRIGGVHVVSGDIVLFHDDYSHTAEAMSAIVAGLKQSGLRPETVGGLTASD